MAYPERMPISINDERRALHVRALQWQSQYTWQKAR
jgi:hypothetical protein